MITLDHAPKEVIKGIIGEFVSASVGEMDAATEFCAGYPQIAVLVGRAMQDGAQHFANFMDKELVVQKLVWGHEPVDDSKWRALRTAAIFSAIGINEQKADQVEWVAAKLLGVSSDEFQHRLEPFKKQRVVQEQGYSLNVVPRPIAAQLAADFWSNVTHGQKVAIHSADMPDELKQALCERLADLNYLSNAKAIAAQLCGPQGPFGTAEALNTEVGAHCLRELAAVAPDEAMEALERCFGTWPEEKLRAEFGPGRRWTVWALDGLVWDRATFEPAMRFLYRLAVAENETWGNNSTGEFEQRFRIQLPGTETSLEVRAGVLQNLVDASELHQLDVLLRALKSLLDSRMSSRMLGSENQGSRKPYIDYNPRWNEVWPYLNRGMEMFCTLARRHPDQVGTIRKEFASSVTGLLVAAPTIAQFETTISELNRAGGVWAELLSRLSHVLRYELADADSSVVRPVRALFDKLSPKTLAEQIQFFVKEAEWGFVDPDADERDFEAPVRRAEKLGQECASDFRTFVEMLPALSMGEGKQNFAFGKALLQAAEKRDEFVEAALGELSRVSDRPDPSLVGGFIAAIAADDLTSAEQFVRTLLDKPEIRKFAPYFAAISLSPELMRLLSALVRAGALEPRSLSILGNGRAMESLPPESVQHLLEALKEQGVIGALVALDLLSMYVHGNEAKKAATMDFASELLQVPGLLRADSITTMDEHHFEVVATYVLASPEVGAKLAKSLSEELVVAPNSREYRSDRLRATISALLVEKFPDVFVSRLAAEIEHGAPSTGWRMESLLGSRFGTLESKANPFFSLGVSRLRDLCRRYPKRFALFVARIAPLFASEVGTRDWTDIAKMLFDELGNRKDALSEIGANLHTGSWAGPTSEHLKGFLPPLRTLLNHALPDVRRWAKREISAIEEQIAHELRDEQEWTLRRG